MIHDICIVIPCIQELELLLRCLSSIEKIMPKQKVIVIHMGDWKENILSQFDLLIKVIKVKQISAAKARNLGASFVATDYVWFLDSDSWLVTKDAQLWQEALAKAISQKPDLIVLQRAEEERTIKKYVKPNQWNFSRHCIEWNLIWNKKHFFNIGKLNEKCGIGSENLAQAGEVFTPLFKHFSCRDNKTIYLPFLKVGHPSLTKPTTKYRLFEYQYGSSYTTFQEIRCNFSCLAIYWFTKTLGGCILDIRRGWNNNLVSILVTARLLALWDAIITGYPRCRSSQIYKTINFIGRINNKR